jgi:hypothetical protein
MMLDDLSERGCLNDLGCYPYENIHQNFPVVFQNAMESYNLPLGNFEEEMNTNRSIEYILKKTFADREPSADRLAIFLSNYATPSILADNYTSPSWLERYAIAQNNLAPDPILERLCQDSNAIVRAATKANQNART